MFIKKYQMNFIFLLIVSTIIACSASSWFTAWLGLELNLMMMIPLIISKFNSNSSEAAIKYFLTQTMASTIFIFSCSLNLLNFKTNFSINNDIIMAIALMIKGGIPPMHFWFPQVMEKISFDQCFIILTWQKISPFILISFILNYSMLMVIILSGLIGSWGGFNQTSLKKILTYSSIIHSSWMMTVVFHNISMWMFYFSVYSLISFALIHLIFFTQINNIKSLSLLKINFSLIFLFSMNILSLGGLPPLLGFIPKMMVIYYLFLTNFSYFIMSMMILSSIIGLFFYLKIIYSLILINSSKISFLSKKFQNKTYNFIISMSIFMNLILPILMVGL